MKLFGFSLLSAFHYVVMNYKENFGVLLHISRNIFLLSVRKKILSTLSSDRYFHMD